MCEYIIQCINSNYKYEHKVEKMLLYIANLQQIIDEIVTGIVSKIEYTLNFEIYL